MKLILKSWFRTGSAYTSNGICEVMKQTLASLPRRIRRIFFRADSGYFKGVLRAILPDNLKSAVTKNNKYEPTLNESFANTVIKELTILYNGKSIINNSFYI